MASNNAQYPVNAVQIKNNPTSALGIVSKFDLDSKYRAEEEILNEDGTLVGVVYVDFTNEADVEICMATNATNPTPGSVVAFNFTNTNLGTGNVNYLIRGDVKVTGNAGMTKRVSFKAITNSALP